MSQRTIQHYQSEVVCRVINKLQRQVDLIESSIHRDKPRTVIRLVKLTEELRVLRELIGE